MATISIEGMRFYAHHGCFDEEQKIGTHFIVDVSFTADTSRAEESDNIEDTVNYLSAYKVIGREMQIPSHLLEHVARRIGDALLNEFASIEHVTVKVRKLNPPLGGQIASSAVEIGLSR